MKPLVVYHADCMDGFAGAWIIHEDLQREGGGADYLAYRYGDQFDIRLCSNRVVYFIDCSLKYPEMEKVLGVCHTLKIIEHHKTAEFELNDLPLRDRDTIKFDSKRSAASLAWSYSFGGMVPPFIQHIEDRDLGFFGLPNTREITDSIASYPYDFETYSKLFKRCSTPDGRKELIIEGRAISRWKEQQVKITIAEHARKVSLDGHSALAVNQPIANLRSQIAGELAKDKPFGIAYYQAAGGHWVYSLVSVDGGIDVSLIARQHGGGGQRHAAGFKSYVLLI